MASLVIMSGHQVWGSLRPPSRVPLSSDHLTEECAYRSGEGCGHRRDIAQRQSQILLAIMATCTVKVAKAKNTSGHSKAFWIGNCFCLALVPRTWAIKSKTGSIAVRRRRKSSAFSGCWM